MSVINMPKDVRKSIGVFANILSPQDRQKLLLQMFVEKTGKTTIEVKATADPQSLQVWYRPKVAPELQ